MPGCSDETAEMVHSKVLDILNQLTCIHVEQSMFMAWHIFFVIDNSILNSSTKATLQYVASLFFTFYITKWCQHGINPPCNPTGEYMLLNYFDALALSPKTQAQHLVCIYKRNIIQVLPLHNILGNKEIHQHRKGRYVRSVTEDMAIFTTGYMPSQFNLQCDLDISQKQTTGMTNEM
jgi:hypothetical protein